MTYAGVSINKIGVDLQKRDKMLFAYEMMRQLIPALQKVHNMGFSHGDIKHENICVRTGSNGKLKFTLIDFGVSSALPNLGQNTENKRFRGNLNFASPEHIIIKRASRIDDLYSLVCVAYKFVFLLLPWEEYLKKEYDKHGDDNIFSIKEVTFIRIKKMQRFENELIRKGNQLSKLFEYLRKLRTIRSKIDKRHQEAKQLADDYNSVDYKLLLNLIPNKWFTKNLANLEEN